MMNDLYQEVILDHNKNPRNFGEIKGIKKEGFNPLCGDEVSIFVNKKDGKINNISFVGTGCAISKASASMMTQSLKGKSVHKAKQLFDEFITMITKNTIGSHLDDLEIFSSINQYPTRAKCATLCWHALSEALE